MQPHTPAEFLLSLLKTKSLQAPDGRALFAYDLSQEHYEALQQALSSAITEAGGLAMLAEKSLGSNALHAPPAAFVLYASEWWKREYSGGPWSWATILKSLDVRPETFAQQLRSAFVLRGLSFWRLPVHQQGRRFIGPIVTNSGIPMRLLATGAGAVTALLVQVLRQAARFCWEPAQILSAVTERQGQLPHAYQHDLIAGLLAKFVEVVLELRTDFKLQNVLDPIGTLDQQKPDWRKSFPISLETEAAQSLLTGLVREAASQTTGNSNGLFVAERRLVRELASDKFFMEAELNYPPRIAATDFAALFGLKEPDALPRYFTIDLEADQRQSCTEGRLKLGTTEPTVLLTGRKIKLRRQAARSELQLVLRTPDGDRGDRFTVEGGSELNNDEPWIFVANEAGDPVLAGVGGARLSQSSAWLALAPGWTIESSDTTPVSVGELELHGEAPRGLLYVQTDTTVTSNGVRYRIRLNQTTQPGQMYQWQGIRLREAHGRAVFRDRRPPRLLCASDDGLRAVPSSQQEWRRIGSQDAVAPNTARGPIMVRISEGDELLARQRIFVLPPEANIRYVASPTLGQAQVRFENWGSIELATETPVSVRSKVMRESEQCWVIDLNTDTAPPSTFQAQVRWAGCSTELTLSLVFPVNGGRFLRGDGSVMQPRETVTLRDLMGMRLQIFDNHPDQPKQYELRLTLGQGLGQITSPHAITLQPGAGQAELRLMDYKPQIESLLGLFDDLDAKVSIGLFAAGQEQCTIRVARYAAVMQVEDGRIRVPEAALPMLGTDALEQTALQATSLIHPDTGAIALDPLRSEGVHTGIWELPNLPADQGPWLIQPTPDAAVLLRPLLWPGSQNTDNGGTESLLSDVTSNTEIELAAAMTETNPVLRGQQIHIALKAMSEQHQHASWPLFDHLWRAFRHLPLSALDAWRMLAKHPKALISFVLRSELPIPDLIEVLRRLQRETAWMPELTTVEDLCEVAQTHRAYYVSLGLSQNLAEQCFKTELENRFELLKSEIPSLSPLIETVIFAMTGTMGSTVIEAATAPTAKLAQQLWTGVDSLVNVQLFLMDRGQSAWPQRNFVGQHAFPGFFADLPLDSQKKIAHHLTQIFWEFREWQKYYAHGFNPQFQNHFRFSVVNMPVLCALWAATSTSRKWWAKSSHRLALRQIRDFDPIWFEQAYRQAFKILLSIDGLIQLPQTTN